MAGALGSCPVSGTGQAFRRNDEGNAEGVPLCQNLE
jgi:hypothetical protein